MGLWSVFVKCRFVCLAISYSILTVLSLVGLGHNLIHTHTQHPFIRYEPQWAAYSKWLSALSALYNVICVTEQIPCWWDKGCFVSCFSLWDCCSFLGHCLWWTLKCINELEGTENCSLWGALLTVSHTFICVTIILRTLHWQLLMQYKCYADT